MDHIPLGVQPVQDDGLLVCRYCGRGYKFLAPHLTAAHGVTAQEYKDEFELPARGLISESVLVKRQAHARNLIATDPRVRDGILNHDPVLNRRWLKRARKAHAKAAKLAGVQAIWQENGRHAAALNAQARRDAHNNHARSLGYDSLAALLAANVHLSNPELGALLGCSATRASSLRREHGAPSQFYRHKTQRTKQAHDDATQQTWEQTLDSFGDTIQPRNAKGRWQCVTCGKYPAALRAHLQQKHGILPGRYINRLYLRARLDQAAQDHGYPGLPGLFADIPLHGTEKVAEMLGHSRRHLCNIAAFFADLPALPAFEDMAAFRSSAASRAQQRKRDEALRRYNAIAREKGYTNITSLLAETRDQPYYQVAGILGIPSGRIQHLRQRYLHQTAGPRSR